MLLFKYFSIQSARGKTPIQFTIRAEGDISSVTRSINPAAAACRTPLDSASPPHPQP